MKLAVVGVGGVGGYFGGRLAQAGLDVTFLARGRTLDVLRSRGLHIESIHGDATIGQVQATDDPAAVGPVDVVLLAVKAWQVREAAAALGPLVGPDTMVVPLQNGVEAPAQLGEVLGTGPVIGGLCRIFSHVVEPGHIRHVAAEPIIICNELHNQPTPRVQALVAALTRAGVKAEIAPDIQVALWSKFAFVCATGTIGAITRQPFGVMRTFPPVRTLLEQAVQEIVHVAQARQVAMPPASFAQTWSLIESTAPSATTSMQRDLMDGRPSELDSQSGAVVRLGQAAGVAVPVHTFAYHSLLPSEHRVRGLLEDPG